MIKDKIRKVIFITHAFPPAGGGGVQRLVKFIKYLPESEFQCSVITAASVLKTTRDETLLKEIEGKVKIKRAFSPDPMFIADMFNFRSSSSTHHEASSGTIKKKYFPYCYQYEIGCDFQTNI